MIVIVFEEGCHFTIDNIPFGVFSLSGSLSGSGSGKVIIRRKSIIFLL
jgi:hypothetical protein